MTNDPTVIRLQQLAQVAAQHAAEFYGIALSDAPEQSLAQIEIVLSAERTHREQIPTLSTCYGAWFGELLRRTLGGHWISLYEAFAPRVALGRAVVSPIDAVRRRMVVDDAPPLLELYQRAHAWAQDMPILRAVLAHNVSGWDRLVRDPRFVADGVPPDRAAAEAALDPWLLANGVADRKVLCLAAGGGRHGPLLARAGAEVTVLDLSPAQLAIDVALATRHDLRLSTIVGSIDDLPTHCAPASFDVVIQPVSTCYLRELTPVHQGLAHVLRAGGLLVAQHKQPVALQVSSIMAEGWLLDHMYVEGLPLPSVLGHHHREPGTQEFLHTLDGLLGGLCRAGFVIEDVCEPACADAWATPGSPDQRAAYLPPYLKVKARRR